jgi:hypothetical protein
MIAAAHADVAMPGGSLQGTPSWRPAGNRTRRQGVTRTGATV